MRQSEQIVLPREWSHQSCDQSYQPDEEYFVVSLWPMVSTNNSVFGAELLADIRRRANKPQVRNLIRAVMNNAGPVTSGGIHLPRNLVVWRLDERRIQRIALKTAQGILFRSCKKFFAESQCFDIRLIETPEDIDELYQLAMNGTEAIVVHPKIFTSWHLYIPDHQCHFIAMLFWESFLWCAGFTDETSVAPPVGRVRTKA